MNDFNYEAAMDQILADRRKMRKVTMCVAGVTSAVALAGLGYLAYRHFNEVAEAAAEAATNLSDEAAAHFA